VKRKTIEKKQGDGSAQRPEKSHIRITLPQHGALEISLARDPQSSRNSATISAATPEGYPPEL
jgi:hypothetical protein